MKNTLLRRSSSRACACILSISVSLLVRCHQIISSLPCSYTSLYDGTLTRILIRSCSAQEGLSFTTPPWIHLKIVAHVGMYPEISRAKKIHRPSQEHGCSWGFTVHWHPLSRRIKNIARHVSPPPSQCRPVRIHTRVVGSNEIDANTFQVPALYLVHMFNTVNLPFTFRTYPL